MALRGIRGATTVSRNRQEEIVAATRSLLEKMVRINRIKPADIASVIFSTSPDITAEFPAVAARQLGWLFTPLLCTHEMSVPGSLKKCIRVLLHVNTVRPQKKIINILPNNIPNYE